MPRHARKDVFCSSDKYRVSATWTFEGDFFSTYLSSLLENHFQSLVSWRQTEDSGSHSLRWIKTDSQYHCSFLFELYRQRLTFGQHLSLKEFHLNYYQESREIGNWYCSQTFCTLTKQPLFARWMLWLNRL